MGLIQSNDTRYLTIVNGKIALRVKTPNERTTERTTKTGKVVHEELYDAVEAMVTGITTRESDYGEQLVIHLHDNAAAYQLQMPLSSGPANCFFRAMENIKLDQPVAFRPKQETKDGKTKTFLFLGQKEGGVKWKYTRDNPGDLPQLKKIKVKGKEQWDDSDQLEFWRARIAEISTKFKASGGPVIGADPDAIMEDAPF